MSGRILYTKPSITELEVELATDAARNGWGSACYDYIDRFEAMFRAFCGSEFAIATSSCTGALHMGLCALGIGPGDEVILSDTNWIATVAPVVHLGATPVFVDIDAKSWCIDPEQVERAVTPRTKAIIATHIYGNLADIDRLLAIGARHGLPVIEDAAEAIGSHWGDRHAGSRGIFGTFSFHGTKTLTTGEGGMFVTNDANLYETVLTLSNHGRARGQTKQFFADMVGFKYKMPNIAAAIGCAQMQRIGELVDRKRAIFQAYADAFADLPVAMNPEPPGTSNGFWMPTIVCDEATGVTREALQAAFRSADIDARVFFHPLSSLPMFEAKPANARAYAIPARAINLPTYHDMGEHELSRVIDTVRRVMGRP